MNVFPGWFSNIVVGGYHYFLCFTDAASKSGPPYCVGRVNIETDKVEYLELPVQVIREPNAARRIRLGHSRSRPPPSMRAA